MLKPLQVSFIEEPGHWERGGGLADKLTETKSCLTGARCFSLPDLQEVVLDAEGQQGKKKSCLGLSLPEETRRRRPLGCTRRPFKEVNYVWSHLPRENVLLFDLVHGMKTEALLGQTHGEEKLKGGCGLPPEFCGRYGSPLHFTGQYLQDVLVSVNTAAHTRGSFRRGLGMELCGMKSVVGSNGATQSRACDNNLSRETTSPPTHTFTPSHP